MRICGRWVLPLAGILAMGMVALAIHMIGLAISTPVVRHLRYTPAGWPAGTPPLRVVLMTDVHVHDLGRSRDRAGRIVAQINALAPDIVLLGGDFVGGDVQTHPAKIMAALAPLGTLRPRLGTIAVLGNHDHWSQPRQVGDALRAGRIIVLSNEAVRLGPLAIGGADDSLTHHADIPAVLRAMRRLGGPHILLSHGPQPFADRRIDGLMLAGHTHCGQVALPLLGEIAPMPADERRYLCGIFDQPGRMLVVSAGVGTSRLPIRLGVPPDLWVIDLGGH